jgi:hypothetical protein
MAAMRPRVARVHIPSLNHASPPRSTHFQTASENMLVSAHLFKDAVAYDEPYHLAGVQNFSGLIPVSQKLSKPIFELTDSDGGWSGARWKRTQNGKEYGIKVNIEEANMVYTRLAEAILKMI